MEPARSYQDLIVWQKAMDAAVAVYRFTDTLPDSEKFGIVNQLRRAAVSVPSNIAEGYRRRGVGDYLRFLHIAYGSASEIETQLLLTRRLEKGDEANRSDALAVLQEVLKLLNRFVTSLNT